MGTLKEQYGNYSKLYPTEDMKIYSQEFSLLKFRRERALDTSNLSFHVPVYSIGTTEGVNLIFPVYTL
tara:strand:+ start:244 stop:447 length:204 start_codon:yes stop_codon:yes gene_type:complete